MHNLINKYLILLIVQPNPFWTMPHAKQKSP